MHENYMILNFHYGMLEKINSFLYICMRKCLILATGKLQFLFIGHTKLQKIVLVHKYFNQNLSDSMMITI